MLEIVSYLSCLDPLLSSSIIRQLSLVTKAMLCCRGRVTMLNLSRWSGKGGSYRSIQRFYNSSLCWLQMNWTLFCRYQLQDNEVYLLAGDETTVTKSGKSTYGLGRFFSSIYSRAVPGIGFFSLCLIGVSSQQASPLLMEQLEPKMKKQTKVKKEKPQGTGKPGRPKGSQKKNRQEIELTDYLKWIQGHIQKTLNIMGTRVKIAYFVYDGAFGNNECLQMVKQCGLPLISKLQCKSALWFPYEGKYSGKGTPKKYGDKVSYAHLSEKHLKQTTSEKGIEENIYQLQVWHRDFADQLNVTIIQRKRLSDQKVAQVILFSNDLKLSWEKMIHYYRLRFQIEFTFRDAKQFWGLEDFMNINQTPVTNAANLSMFMVNFSHVLGQQTADLHDQSVLDLKARSQAAFYLEKILKIDPQIQEVISLERLQQDILNIGCIHPVQKEPLLQSKTLGTQPLHHSENEEKETKDKGWYKMARKSIRSVATYVKFVTKMAS